MHGFWWTTRANTDIADTSNSFSLAFMGVEKKDGKGTTPHSRSIGFLEYGMKKNPSVSFLMGNCLFMLVFSCYNSLCAFCTCFQKKVRF